MRFEFATATRIIFGRGTVQEVGPLAAEMGNCAFIITDRAVEWAGPLVQQLNKQKIECVTFSVSGEPTTTVVKGGRERSPSDQEQFGYWHWRWKCDGYR